MALGCNLGKVDPELEGSEIFYDQSLVGGCIVRARIRVTEVGEGGTCSSAFSEE